MKKFTEVKNLVASLEADADKFYNKGNSAAGTRVRKGMQDLKNLAQAIRLEIQDIKKQSIKYISFTLSLKNPLSEKRRVFFYYESAY